MPGLFTRHTRIDCRLSASMGNNGTRFAAMHCEHECHAFACVPNAVQICNSLAGEMEDEFEQSICIRISVPLSPTPSHPFNSGRALAPIVIINFPMKYRCAIESTWRQVVNINSMTLRVACCVLRVCVFVFVVVGWQLA